MSTRCLPDMYILSHRALGVHIRQTTHAHGTYNYNIIGSTIDDIFSYTKNILFMDQHFN